MFHRYKVLVNFDTVLNQKEIEAYFSIKGKGGYEALLMDGFNTKKSTIFIYSKNPLKKNTLKKDLEAKLKGIDNRIKIIFFEED